MTNAEARFNKSLRPRKPEGSLGQTAQDVHLDSHTAPELTCSCRDSNPLIRLHPEPSITTDEPLGLDLRALVSSRSTKDSRGFDLQLTMVGSHHAVTR